MCINSSAKRNRRVNPKTITHPYAHNYLLPNSHCDLWISKSIVMLVIGVCIMHYTNFVMKVMCICMTPHLILCNHQLGRSIFVSHQFSLCLCTLLHKSPFPNYFLIASLIHTNIHCQLLLHNFRTKHTLHCLQNYTKYNYRTLHCLVYYTNLQVLKDNNQNFLY